MKMFDKKDLSTINNKRLYPRTNHERDVVSFSFLVRNGTSREKREIENSREK